MKLSIILLAFLFYVFSVGEYSGQGEFSLHGSVRVKNYTQKEYKANAQIFGISATPQGILCFSNQRGVLQYDSEEWRTLVLDNKMESYATLSVGEDILVCNTSGLGVFEKQSNGTFEFKDLSNNYADEKNPISSILPFQDGYVISYLNLIYVLDHEFHKVAEYNDPDNGIGAVSVVNNIVYFRGKNKEVIFYEAGKFKKLNTTGFFQDKNVVSILNFNNKLFFLTENQGLFLLENESSYQMVFNEPNYNFKSALNINDNLLSLGSYVKGLLILDKNFIPRYKINTEKGLNDGTIMCQYLDNEENLWIGTANGISKLDLLSPVLKYANLYDEATIEDIDAYDDYIVLATGGGAYKINSSGEINKLKGIQDECFGLNKIIIEGDTSLFISALYNVFKYNNSETVAFAEGGPYNVAQSPLNPNHVLALHYDGIQLLEYNEGKFKEIKYIKGFCDGEPFNFQVQQDGYIWIGTKPNDGVYKLDMNVFFESEFSFERFYTTQGLPSGQTYLFDYKNNIYVGTDIGVYKYNEGKFILTNEFGIDFSTEQKGVHRINADEAGNVWMVIFKDATNTYEIGYSKLDDGVMQWHPEYFYSYDEYIVHSVFHLNDNITWLGGPGGLMSFDKSLIKEKNHPFDALLRMVKLGDSIIYGGNGSFEVGGVFDYNPKKLFEFKFASSSYFAEEKTVYSFYLEGYDLTWSAWSEKTVRDYSLSEGSYTFHVKAKNILGVESSTISYTFEVLPPWYRTWWAYFIFLIVFIGVIILVVKLSIRRIKLQNVKLEKIVKERTEEVVAQKAEAEKQRDFAKEQQHLVEEKNLEITDSINYAKRLQNAILTPVKTIQETFNDSFIFYLPKDIVAGDFYWTNLAKSNNRNSRSLIAAADCTGHGVPGAMVSVVCSNALDRSVKEFGLIVPSKILDKVTDLVIETFEQSEDEVKDGMDIAICSYETKGDFIEVQYAGANNPLWIVRNQAQLIVNDKKVEPILANEDNSLFLFEVKATKQPVGKYAERKPFENNILTLVEGDSIYSFTDGYADQFGGEKGKKYKYLPFKRFVLSIQNLSMTEQEISLRNEFKSWQGTHEQIDDVCIIGVKL